MAGYRMIGMTVLLLLLLPAAGYSQVAYNQRTDRLTITADGLPLTEILAEVSVKTGIEISITPSADRSVSVDIKARPLEDAIRELIRPFSHLFVYRGNLLKAVKIYAAPSSEYIMLNDPVAVRAGRRLPPSQADLEAMARKAREQRLTSGNRQEDAGKRKQQEEREAKQSMLMTEQERQRAEIEAEAIKRMEAARKQISEMPAGQEPAESPPPPDESPREQLPLTD